MDCLFLLPLALWQTLSTGYAPRSATSWWR